MLKVVAVAWRKANVLRSPDECLSRPIFPAVYVKLCSFGFGPTPAVWLWFCVFSASPGQQRNLLQAQPPEEVRWQHHIHELHPETGRGLKLISVAAAACLVGGTVGVVLSSYFLPHVSIHLSFLVPPTRMSHGSLINPLKFWMRRALITLITPRLLSMDLIRTHLLFLFILHPIFVCLYFSSSFHVIHLRFFPLKFWQIILRFCFGNKEQSYAGVMN